MCHKLAQFYCLRLFDASETELIGNSEQKVVAEIIVMNMNFRFV